MKTIKVNNEIWEEVKIIAPHKDESFLQFKGVKYAPQKKELSLAQIRTNFIGGTGGMNFIDTDAKSVTWGKLRAIRDMIAVADYLNEGEEVDVNFHEIHLDDEGTISTMKRQDITGSFAFFKDETTAYKAIDILGEDTIKTALL